MKHLLVLIALSFFCFQINSQVVIRTANSTTVQKNGFVFITLKIVRNGLTGAAKIEEYIPEGFSAVVTEKSLGNVSLKEERKIKIQWLNLPANDTIIVRYKLQNMAVTAEPLILEGVFNYMKDGGFQKYEIPKTTLQVGRENKTASSKTTTVSATFSSEVKTITGNQKNEVSATSSSPEEVKVAVSSSTSSSFSGSNKLTENVLGMTYSIQLGAFSVEKNKAIFNRLPEIHMNRINGLYKYYSGRFTSEAEARSRLTLARALGYGDAFLVVLK